MLRSTELLHNISRAGHLA